MAVLSNQRIVSTKIITTKLTETSLSLNSFLLFASIFSFYYHQTLRRHRYSFLTFFIFFDVEQCVDSFFQSALVWTDVCKQKNGKIDCCSASTMTFIQFHLFSIAACYRPISDSSESPHFIFCPSSSLGVTSVQVLWANSVLSYLIGNKFSPNLVGKFSPLTTYR